MNIGAGSGRGKADPPREPGAAAESWIEEAMPMASTRACVWQVVEHLPAGPLTARARIGTLPAFPPLQGRSPEVAALNYACGIDFGTTNSVAAIARTDPAEPEIVAEEPSCLLVTDDGARQRLYVGREAIARYRGEPGSTRFVKSMKSVLADPGFVSTKIFGRTYTPQHLVRPVLAHLKAKAEEAVGEPVRRVVMGRPVHFSSHHENDGLAVERLRDAARLAGFEEIAFLAEPIAASWSCAAGLDRESRVLVADIGGGTADFCVVLLRPDGRHEVLSTGGVRIGGDDFDSRIMWNRLVAAFGYGSRFESWDRMLEVPVHLYVALCRWDRIPFLKDSRTWADLRYILGGSTDRPAIARLMTLIDEDLGFPLYQAIATAKHELSRAERAGIVFDESGLEIDESLCRDEFEAMIAEHVEGMAAAAEETLRMAGICGERIDSCFLTGGCSLVPAVARRFSRIVAPDRLRTRADTFTSVATGLALFGLRDV